ncbi:aldose epimerase family protein [Vibrio sp. WXL210]|uniref:aldose epimerase family protein n=1 Tax=Vibrio sp. WXL210 TaxID=3450709 RepID=UPI003EC637E9
MPIDTRHVGYFYNQSVHQVTMTSSTGMSVSILTLGGIIKSLLVPNRSGELVDVVLGYDTLADYANDPHYMGAIIGRVANRIENAQFDYQGRTIKVNANAYQGKHCVHGGRFGYHRRVWKIVGTSKTEHSVSLTLGLVDNDGEEGFPSKVDVLATYTLTSDNQLSLEVTAQSNAPSPFSTTAHSYFNLNGHSSGYVGDHRLSIPSQQRLQQKQERVPNGELINVEGTPFDFQHPKSLAECVDQALDINDSYTLAYDGKTNLVAELTASQLGLRVYSNERTLHFYNGHNLDTVNAKFGATYHKFAGVCLEPKGYVNAVNIDHFPLSEVTPDKPYQHKIIYQFFSPE